MVEREWQTHAQPPYAGGDFHCCAGGGQRLAKDIFKLGFLRIHSAQRMENRMKENGVRRGSHLRGARLQYGFT